MPEPATEPARCLGGCDGSIGEVHRLDCVYRRPWPRDRVDRVQTQIAPPLSNEAPGPRAYEIRPTIVVQATSAGEAEDRLLAVLEGEVGLTVEDLGIARPAREDGP